MNRSGTCLMRLIMSERVKMLSVLLLSMVAIHVSFSFTSNYCSIFISYWGRKTEQFMCEYLYLYVMLKPFILKCKFVCQYDVWGCLISYSLFIFYFLMTVRSSWKYSSECCQWQKIASSVFSLVITACTVVPSTFHRNVLWMQAESDGIFSHTRLFI